MIIAVNKVTGKVYNFVEDKTYSTDDFLFTDIEEFKSVAIEDDSAWLDQFFLVEVNKVLIPEVDYEEVGKEGYIC